MLHPVTFGFGETVTHLPYLGVVKDTDGHRHTRYADPVEVPNVGIDIDTTPDEPRDGASNQLDQAIMLFLPPGFVCDSKDLFIIRGKKYEAVGPGIPLTNMFTGSVYNTEVRVRGFEDGKK